MYLLLSLRIANLMKESRTPFFSFLFVPPATAAEWIIAMKVQKRCHPSEGWDPPPPSRRQLDDRLFSSFKVPLARGMQDSRERLSSPDPLSTGDGNLHVRNGTFVGLNQYPSVFMFPLLSLL